MTSHPDLRNLLQPVIAAAEAAGRTLAAEFVRPAGPRGGADHADVDDEIETALRSNSSNACRRAGGAKRLVCLPVPAGPIAGSSIPMTELAPSWLASAAHLSR